MDRRSFIRRSFMLAVGGMIAAHPELASAMDKALAAKGVNAKLSAAELYKLFQNPDMMYHPFVRWWWNGDKVEADEIKRELKLLKDAGVGGVEINPIKFPGDDDLSKKSLKWLSDEWIDMVKLACEEAKKLDMTPDLLVGSGWPYGAETLKDDERAQIVCTYKTTLVGPIDYEASDDGLFIAANPGIGNQFIGKKMELMSLVLVPEKFENLNQVRDVKSEGVNGIYKIQIPEGRWVLCALVKIKSFMEVINGAPGANGPVLDHFKKDVVKGYLTHMSDTIQNRIGPLKNYIRSLFTDSMELEGSNWTDNYADEFRRRRGYDLMPYLPFILFKAGSMGNVVDYDPKVKYGKELGDTIDRVRFDFELTKAELMDENFTQVYLEWCKSLGVKSRAQAYGRGLFPLETSMGYDIPEGESWTTNWLRHKLGEEMSEKDYRKGRGYTMIDKFVSSAAHLAGKRLVSCEEMTNTYLVFATSLEFLKLGSDQSTISGITHSIWHGFNYSPNKDKSVKFPGWIRYGSYYSENNYWWPYFKYLNLYKARLSSALQHATMYTDIAILNPYTDMWTKMGMQNEPFPERMYADWTTLVWEAIVKTGGGCDYVSENIIQKSTIKDGCLCYGPCKYSTLFMLAVEIMDEKTAQKLEEFVRGGGKIICVETTPHLSCGLHNHAARDKQVADCVARMKAQKGRFIEVKKPAEHFIDWYSGLQKQYNLPHFLEIAKPNPYLMINRYRTDDKAEMFFISYSNLRESHQTRITFLPQITKGRTAWVWDLDTGARYKLPLGADGGYDFDFGPVESLLVVFEKNGKGETWKPVPAKGADTKDITSDWDVEFRYAQEDKVEHKHYDKLIDLVDDKDFASFGGTAVYKRTVELSDPQSLVLNLGRIDGVAEVLINGQNMGVKWYGRRLVPAGSAFKAGKNEIEVRVTTNMSNYLAQRKDDKSIQRWIRKRDNQSMGLIGPVTIYKV